LGLDRAAVFSAEVWPSVLLGADPAEGTIGDDAGRFEPPGFGVML
jgi:hypothetical protein